MIKSINNIYSLHKPTASGFRMPVVFDSPHSGVVYPMNSGIVAPSQALKTTWDAYVDELWDTAPRAGASLLAARFPRAYIDPNRSPQDIDPAMLSGPWPEPVSMSAACTRGMGLIRRYALPGVPMYDRLLPVAEVEQRIKCYYLPYHAALKEMLDAAHDGFGSVWHINCHSMKSVGNAMNADRGEERPDIVVSDCNGMSASSRFTEWVAEQFDLLGYRVRINSPYQGGHIVKEYGVPELRRQSVQIEIKRNLYMNEATFEKTEGFMRLKQNLGYFVSRLTEYVTQELAERQADLMS